MRARLMNGAGNKFILADLRDRAVTIALSPDDVREMAARHGFDQLLLLERSDSADAFMRIWNADGIEVGACGNGTRAAGWALMEDAGTDAASIDTVGGRLQAGRAGAWSVSVDMGTPRLDWQDIPLARAMDTVSLDYAAEADGQRVSAPGAVNMGNPHAVFFVDNVETMPLDRLGPAIETDPLFPQRVNAGFAQIVDRSHIRLKVWERGTGLTAACGTGACAALVAAHRRGLTGRSADIRADGGVLHIDWRASDGHVILTGPVEDEGDVEITL
mgnify:CR=1 FL=1